MRAEERRAHCRAARPRTSRGAPLGQAAPRGLVGEDVALARAGRVQEYRVEGCLEGAAHRGGVAARSFDPGARLRREVPVQDVAQGAACGRPRARSRRGSPPAPIREARTRLLPPGAAQASRYHSALARELEARGREDRGRVHVIGLEAFARAEGAPSRARRRGRPRGRASARRRGRRNTRGRCLGPSRLSFFPSSQSSDRPAESRGLSNRRPLD